MQNISYQSVTPLPVVGLIGALDTKGKDCGFLREQLVENGCRVVVINIGVFAAATPYPIDVECSELLQPTVDIEDLRLRKDRPFAIKAIEMALASKIVQIVHKFGISALIGPGGTNGTSIITTAMQQMPIRMPKICISTLAQHENWEYTRHAGINLWDPCVDAGGLNAISRDRYSDAVVVVASLAKKYIKVMSIPELTPKKAAIAISMLGNTTECFEKCRTLLEDKFDVMPFHAIGTGGKNMELLVKDGTIRGGVIDLALQEIAAFICGGMLHAGPGRLDAPGDTNTPHLLIPGGVDMVILGNIAEAKEKFPERHLYECNKNVTVMRTSKKDNKRIGKFIAKKMNAAMLKGCPVAILIPAKGFSMFAKTLQNWNDPKANKAFSKAILKYAHPDLPVKIVDAYINDSIFAEEAAVTMLKLIARQKLVP